MTQPIRTTSPEGEPIVILSAADYDRLLDAAEAVRDARVADRAMAAYRADPESVLDASEMTELLASSSGLAFWRRKRGFSAEAFADTLGCTVSELSAMEAGERQAPPQVVQIAAEFLRVSPDDLVDPAV